MMSGVNVACRCAAVMVLVASVAHAARPDRESIRLIGHARPYAVRTVENQRRIDINNLNLFVSNDGAYGYDTAGRYNGGLLYPKHTTSPVLFAAGLWLAAKVGGEYRATVAEYTQEYLPGRILTNNPVTADVPGDPALVVYKVNRFRGAPSDTAHLVNPHDPRVELERAEDPLLHHSWSEYMAGAVPYGAPWRLWRLDNTATPAPGDSVDVPGPDLLGDQMLWCVYNDALAEAHTNEAGNTAPLDVQVEQSTFAFDRIGPLGNAIFIKYRLTNKGSQQLDSMYVAQWSDPDLGQFTDDLMGCDVRRDGAGRRRSLGFVYNGTNADAIYGSLPPALGIDVLKGPVVLKVPGVGIDTLGLTSFVRFIGGVDPISAIESYNWMRGFSTDSIGNPDPIVDPFGDVTKFMFAGDPFARATHGGQDRVDWVDQSPSDRRMLLSSGPFSLAPGESQDVVVAILVGQCGDRLNSLRHLDFVDDAAHEAFNLGFEIPAEPRPPAVTLSSDHGTVTLGWDRAVEAEPLAAGYTFEGYNVYQGATIAGPWRLVTTLDARDGIRELDGPAFNVGQCESLPLVPLAHGTDIGLASSYSTSQDFVNGTTLKDGSDYYYAVTTYAVNPAATPGERVVESPLQSNVVRPQREAGSVSARQVLPVPNPYYAHSAYESSRAFRRIRFLNVPARATIRIYNLAGQLVRTLEKNDPSTSVLEWDVLTEHGLSVGSGVYVYQVDTPGGGFTGRLVVVMEQEWLSDFPIHPIDRP